MDKRRFYCTNEPVEDREDREDREEQNEEWKKVVTSNWEHRKMFNWRVSAMLDYLESMIVNGALGKDIIKVMHKYKAWLKDEVND